MEENIIIKKIFSRKLKNGNYVILASDSEPLVVEEEFAMRINQDVNVIRECDDEVISIFRDGGFFSDASSDIRIPKEPAGLIWNILRIGVFIISALALVSILITIPISGIPLGDRIIPNNIPIWMSLVFLIGFSFLTTILHELLHMLYAATWKKRQRGLKIAVRKSMATVAMTHIWVWSFLGRISAVSAGIMSDLFLLSICSIIGVYDKNWIISAATAILWVRILWQFRFHKNTDGRLILMFLIDNPMIGSEKVQSADISLRKHIMIWKVFQFLGVIIGMIIIVCWEIPLILNIYENLFIGF